MLSSVSKMQMKTGHSSQIRLAKIKMIDSAWNWQGHREQALSLAAGASINRGDLLGEQFVTLY